MMLEAGVHFGHHTRRWNPKMARYIFGERNGIHILDLQKAVKDIKKACLFVKEQSQQGKKFLFVGTKKQAKDIIREEALRCNVSCVYEKWLGGILTNFFTIRKSVKRLEELEKWEKDGLFRVVSKKEVSRLTKEMTRLKKLLTGIRSLNDLPDIIFVIDPVEESGAISEARKLNIPVVAVCDTNCDPDLIDWPMPGNDDAARAIKLFCSIMADSVLEGREAAKASEPGKGAPADLSSKAAEEQAVQGEDSAESGQQTETPSSETAENGAEENTAAAGVNQGAVQMPASAQPEA